MRVILEVMNVRKKKSDIETKRGHLPVKHHQTFPTTQTSNNNLQQVPFMSHLFINHIKPKPIDAPRLSFLVLFLRSVPGTRPGDARHRRARSQAPIGLDELFQNEGRGPTDVDQVVRTRQDLDDFVDELRAERVPSVGEVEQVRECGEGVGERVSADGDDHLAELAEAAAREEFGRELFFFDVLLEVEEAKTEGLFVSELELVDCFYRFEERC